ncbi:hypothetical protein Tfer_3308 [Thermincola ferriacetica]|uniref:Uncharacterized protein n=1 Tax=Thermincola ferriacetica TaxID=281456 RepID=A0A0L6VYD0_9FIRM|nr:hypothetical protein Tfer_3308 [Thermincola ferriacetica]
MSAFCITADRSDRDLPGAVYEARTYGSVRGKNAATFRGVYLLDFF